MESASLGMYDGVGVHAANDLLWRLVAERLRGEGVADVPSTLDRTRSLDALWSDRDLLFAQCCGYPLMTRYRGRLRYLATPCYEASGCAGPLYCSLIIVRASDDSDGLGGQRGRRAAVNEPTSNTGMNLFRGAIAPLAAGAPFFSAVIVTGSHRASVEAVADGRADVAAIDAVSLHLLARVAPDLAARVRTVACTRRTPGLPFVTSTATPGPVVAHLRRILRDVVHGAEFAPARDILPLRDVRCMPANAYASVIAIEEDAARLGYPGLA